jgi:transcriptional regulator with XRE-family HTH domain
METTTPTPLAWDPAALRAARVYLGMHQDHVADAVGVHALTYGKWERGQTAPDAEQLARLCKVLRIDIRRLYRVSDAA